MLLALFMSFHPCFRNNKEDRMEALITFPVVVEFIVAASPLIMALNRELYSRRFKTLSPKRVHKISVTRDSDNFDTLTVLLRKILPRGKIEREIWDISFTYMPSSVSRQDCFRLAEGNVTDTRWPIYSLRPQVRIFRHIGHQDSCERSSSFSFRTLSYIYFR